MTNVMGSTKIGKHVLVAEDSLTQAAKLQYLLESNGYSVTHAKNGEEALERALAQPPDLLISDIIMPRMNGYELARRLRAESAVDHVPIILLTTLSDPHDIILGLECGADNFIRKPYDDDYLLQRINYILTNKLLRQREKLQMGIEIDLKGTRHFITAEKQQIFDLLISSYEEAVYLNRSLELSNQSLNGLYRVAEGLNQCTSQRDVMDRLLERVLELPCVSAGWIYSRDSAGEIRVAASRGMAPELVASGILDGTCECKRRLADGSLDCMSHLLDCERMKDGGTCGHACIPLWVDDEVRAVLNLAGDSGTLFSDDELKILYGVGHQAGLALERARLHENLERLVEQRTRELELRTQLLDHLLLRSATNIYALTCRHGNFELSWISENIQAIAGWSSEEAMRPEWFYSILHPEDRPAIRRAEAELIEQGFSSREYRIRHKEGHYIWIHDEQRLVRDPAGNPVEVVGSRIDVTSRRDAEEALRNTQEQLYQAQKLESIGSLAGGIAHDMNNVLAAICGYTEMVLNELPPEDPHCSDLNAVMTAGMHGAKLVSQILAFSRKQVLRPEVLNLNEIITDFTKMIARLLGEDIELHNALAPDLRLVSADAIQMEQVLMNLVINARDAMPDGGKLTLETANVELDEAYAEHHLEVAPGAYVMLAASDSGTGMDEATRRRIFEPFFTTKEVGRGTGLGLATVYGIVKQHNGSIWVYSELGQGTTFKIYLPAVLSAQGKKVESRTAADIPGGIEHILVVEDDQMVRQLIVETLSAKSYRVNSAQDPTRAVEMVEREGVRVELLVTDVILPVMNGKELYRIMQQIVPELKVLYVSGYTHDVISRHGILEKGIVHLQKPFTLQGLLGSVREALMAPASPLQ